MGDKTYVLLDDVIAHIASCERSAMLPVECSAITLIKNIPAAEVMEVRHGHWIEQPLDFDLCGVVYYQCSECNKEQQTPSNYCQFCGAKMDKGVNE